MRTTVTLDPDVVATLRAMMKERDITFKEALNSAVRLGANSQSPRAKPFRQKTYKMGIRPGINLTKALALADALEDEEIIRKMELGK